MIIVKLQYSVDSKKNGNNWVLLVEQDSKYKYTETTKFTTKPKGRVLRRHIKLLRERVAFSKYWDEV